MNPFNKIFDRINISNILSRHIETFYHYGNLKLNNKKKIQTKDISLFLIFPILLSVIFCILGLQFNKDYVNIALTCLSLFIGLLFGLLTMVFNLVQENKEKSKMETPTNELKKMVAQTELTNYLFINICFSIILCILSLISVLLTQFYPKAIIGFINNWKYIYILKNCYLYMINGITFFLIIELILTLMMIVNRFSILFFNKIDKPY